MPATRQINAGKISYRTSFVPNPDYQEGSRDLFSPELLAEIRQLNVPEFREVYFDGRHSRMEELNADYGVRSRSFELRSAGSDAITYCKEFPQFGFCLEHPILLPPGGPPPDFADLGETTTIAGLQCQKGEYQGSQHLFVWHTNEVAVSDPTGAVLRLDGVPGLIMQTQEIPVSESTDVIQQVTVTELTSDAPPPGAFTVPEDYRRFPNIEAARAEDRRMLDAESAKELQSHPLSADEREMFVGKWLLDRPKDKIMIEIVRAGESEFQFRTTVLSAPLNVAGRDSDEPASMKGRLLLVEEPPNYRLYKLEDGGQTLAQVGNPLFRFTRA